MTRISGRTRVLAHIGVPTETFTAPLIYNPWFAARGIDTVVVPMGCEAADFDAFLPLVMRLRNVAGALITMPHKVSVTRLLDDASAAVEVCGACNAVRRDARGRLVGDMFDGIGFVRAAAAAGRPVAGTRALVVGAGGVGAAIAAALAEAGVARLSLNDLRAGAAEALATRLRGRYPSVEVRTGQADPAGHDVVVNATPLGMRDDDPLPVQPERIEPGALAGDVVLGRARTALLERAQARGHPVVPGTEMLLEQIPAYLAFFGYPVPAVDELRRHAQL